MVLDTCAKLASYTLDLVSVNALLHARACVSYRFMCATILANAALIGVETVVAYSSNVLQLYIVRPII